MKASLSSHYFYPQFALAPTTLAADSGPARGLQIWHELAQLSLILGNADEAADAVNLPRPAAAPFRIHLAQFAARHSYRIGPLTHRAKVDYERARSIQCTQHTDTIAAASEP